MIRILLAASLLSVGSAAFAQTAEPEQSIVVTAVRLDEGRDRLAACLARKCPPMEDIAATLQYADALFSAGDYRKGGLGLVAFDRPQRR